MALGLRVEVGGGNLIAPVLLESSIDYGYEEMRRMDAAWDWELIRQMTTSSGWRLVIPRIQIC